MDYLYKIWMSLYDTLYVTLPHFVCGCTRTPYEYWMQPKVNNEIGTTNVVTPFVSISLFVDFRFYALWYDHWY